MACHDTELGFNTAHGTEEAVHGAPAFGVAAGDLKGGQAGFVECRAEDFDEVGGLGAVGAH